MAVFGKNSKISSKGNNLSSTNIAEILTAQIEAMKKINDVIVKSKIDQNMLNNIDKTIKTIGNVIKTISDIANLMSTLKITGMMGSLKFKLAIEGLMSNISAVANNLKGITVDKKSETSLGILKTSISSLLEISNDLLKIGTIAIILIRLKPLIFKVIAMIIRINRVLASSSKTSITASVTAAAIGTALSIFAKGILTFVALTLGGVVPLIAIVALSTMKLFMMVFFKLFGPRTIIRLMKADFAIKNMASTFILLSSVVILMALIGTLIVEDWKNIVINITFITTTILFFFLLGLATKFIQAGGKTLFAIAGTLIMLSTVVILWALTGEFIAEEWDNILRTGALVGFAIIIFSVLGFASKFIQSGSKSLLLLALTLVVLSLTVLLWAEIGEIIKEHWLEILIVGGFVIVAVTLCIGLSYASKQIQNSGLVLILLAVSIAILSLTALLFIYIGKQIMENWQPILYTGLFVIVIVGVFFAISFASSFIYTGSLAILAISGALIIFGFGVNLLISNIRDITIDDIGIVVGLLVGLTAAISAIGLVSALVFIGSATLSVMGIALLLFAAPLNLIVQAIKTVKETGIDPEKDKNILKTPIDIMWGAVSSAAKIKTVTLLKGVAKIVALGASAQGISNIADTIQKFAELKIPTKFDKNGKAIEFRPMTKEDFETAANNIQTILTYLLNTISDDQITATLENLSGKAVKNIGLIMENTAGVSNLIEAIEKAVKFDDKTIETGVSNIKSLMSSYIIALQELFVGTGNIVEDKDWLGRRTFELEITGAPKIDSSSIKTSLNSLEKLSETLEPINNILSSLNDITVPSEENVQKIGTLIRTYALSVVGDENGNGGIPIVKKSKEKISTLESIIKEQERIANINPDNFQRNTENFVKFVDKANTIDDKKIKSVRDMFEQIARFSESVNGNFDKLADILSEKLVDILEKLQITLEDISKLENKETVINNNTGKSSIREINTTRNQEEIEKENKFKQQEKNLKDIKNILEEITSALRDIKENTEDFSRY